MNRELVRELEAVLCDELILHENILKLTSRKCKAITSDKIDELEELNAEEKKLSDLIRDKEKARMTAAGKLCADLGIPSNSRLKQIIGNIMGGDRERLAQLRERLLTTIDKIKTQNHVNMELLRQLLGHITAFFDKLGGLTSEQNANYDSSGKSKNAGSNLLINRVG